MTQTHRDQLLVVRDGADMDTIESLIWPATSTHAACVAVKGFARRNYQAQDWACIPFRSVCYLCPMSLWLLALLLVLAAAVAVGLMLVVRRHSPANGFFANPTTGERRTRCHGRHARRPHGIRDLRCS